MSSTDDVCGDVSTLMKITSTTTVPIATQSSRITLEEYKYAVAGTRAEKAQFGKDMLVTPSCMCVWGGRVLGTGKLSVVGYR